MKNLPQNPFFYFQDLTEASRLIILDAQESCHARSARRLREGDAIDVSNGRGLVARGIIGRSRKRDRISVEIISSQHYQRSPLRLHLVSAVPKGGRQHVLLDMAAQLGMTDYSPLDCAYSEARVSGGKRNKWDRFLVESCKQCRRPWLPRIHATTTPAGAMEFSDLTDIAWMADMHGTFPPERSAPPVTKGILLLVGPEGGFNRREQSAMIQAGAVPVCLSDAVLRTETAAVALLNQAMAVLRSRK